MEEIPPNGWHSPANSRHHAHMTAQNSTPTRAWLWSSAAIVGLIMIGLGVYFTRAGLSRSNSIAGVIGLFVAILGLAVTVFTAVQARAAYSRTNSSSTTRMSQQSGSNSTNIQAAGNLTIGDSNTLGGGRFEDDEADTEGGQRQH